MILWYGHESIVNSTSSEDPNMKSDLLEAQLSSIVIDLLDLIFREF